MKQLHISQDLSLPLDAVTRRMAILAMSGAGKSNLAVVLAEAMFDAGIPWVAIDPKGDWWGVRSNESGKGPGLPIPIFGGLHGDVPLEPTAGRLIADLIINQRLTCVLDVSEFATRQQMWAFLHDFGEQLIHDNREALHLFLEEADEYIPQKPGEKGNLVKCKGVWQRVVKRGRFRGLGSTQITQRSASLDKDTLYQAEVLFALRAAGKGDKSAIEGWVEYHNAASEIIDSLPTLADGEGWVSSPAYLKTTKRVQFFRRHTFDSGATPVLLKGTMKPATLADIDLDAINAKMAATIEKAKAEDPKELRRIISDLRAQVRKLESAKPPAETKVKTETKIVEKKIVIEGTVTRVEKLLERAEKLRDSFQEGVGALNTEVSQIGAVLADVRQINEPFQAPPPPKPFGRVDGPVSVRIERMNSATGARSIASPSSVTLAPAHAAQSNGDSPVSGVKQRILNVMAELASVGIPRPARLQVAFMSGYSNLASTGFAKAVGALRTSGLIDYPDPKSFSLTQDGASAADPVDTPATTEALQGKVLNLLGGVKADILRHLIGVYPDWMPRQDLMTKCGYSNMASTGFAKALGTLRTFGLIEYPDSKTAKASDLLFL